MKKLEFRVSTEPLVSCAQAPPAKGHDGVWGRECYVSHFPPTEKLINLFTLRYTVAFVQFMLSKKAKT